MRSPPSDVLPLVVTGEDRVLRIIYGLPRTGMREEPENERGQGGLISIVAGEGSWRKTRMGLMTLASSRACRREVGRSRKRVRSGVCYSSHSLRTLPGEQG